MCRESPSCGCRGQPAARGSEAATVRSSLPVGATRRQALDHQERARISAPTAKRGLAIKGPDAPEIVLTVDDVARIAAAAVADLHA
jgi:hypothetical protein